MRAALQGDFERLRARLEEGEAPMAVATPVAEPVAEPEGVQPVEPVVSEPVVAGAPQPRASWLDRLRDRR